MVRNGEERTKEIEKYYWELYKWKVPEDNEIQKAKSKSIFSNCGTYELLK